MTLANLKILVRHFFRQFWSNELISRNGELGFTAMLGILAVPGAIMCFFLFEKYSSLIRFLRRNFHFDPDIVSLPDKYTFLVFSMTLTGIVTVLRWETLFPDRRDYMNLGPLPIAARAIVIAKMMALIGFVSVFVTAVNLVSTLLFPMIVMENHGTVAGVLRFLFAHAAGVATASVFTFCSVLTLVGILVQVLPENVFRGVSRWMQFALIAAFMLLFFLQPMVTPVLERIPAGKSTGVEWAPPVWFLGLYESAQGKGAGGFAFLAERAWIALSAVCIASLLLYVVSYRPLIRRAEGGGAARAQGGAVQAVAFRLLDRLAARTGFERGCLRFAGKTLFRSTAHGGLLAAYLGLGASLAVQTVTVALSKYPITEVLPPFLAPSLIMMFFLLTGLRLAFTIPAELGANWIFQSSVTELDADAGRLTRKFLTLCLGLLLCISLAIYSMLWGFETAAMHVVYVAALGGILIEALLGNFRKVPFTCSYSGGRTNLVFAFARGFAVLLLIGYGMADLEVYVLASQTRMAIFLVFAAVAWFGIRHLRDPADRIVYDEADDGLQLLALSE